jgi:hexosaminidase
MLRDLVLEQGLIVMLGRRYLKYICKSVLIFLCSIVLWSCELPTSPEKTSEFSPTDSTVILPFPSLIPKPDSVQRDAGSFTLTAHSNIIVNPGTAEIMSIGRYLADRLNLPTGFNIGVLANTTQSALGNIYLTISNNTALGEEGYILNVSQNRVTVVAYQPTGLFRAVQTIRQMLPASIESQTIQSGPWDIPACTIKDKPRFEWRGAMLDVARHFFGITDVKRYIDLIAAYKINRLHLHLADDQGWRIEIKSWPKLVTVGGSTQVGGGIGGYYTQEDYKEIVEYAHSRYIIVVPEIDMPGHITAALASYGELTCNGIATSLYTGTNVGLPGLCVSKDTIYTFINDVIRELSALTPGLYIHIGGDEAPMNQADYSDFIDRAQTIVQKYGKQMVGWANVAQAQLQSTSLIQYWQWNDVNLIQQAVQQGAKVIMSPANKTYLDMKYNSSTQLGQNWAGYIEVQTAYNWDPATQVSGVTETNISGVEAPLWTEYIRNINDIEYMTFPRLIGFAEIGWSSQTGRSWADYKNRLADHGPRLTMMGVNFYKSPQITWK